MTLPCVMAGRTGGQRARWLSRQRNVTVQTRRTRKQELCAQSYALTQAHKDPGQRSLESFRVKKGWLQWAEMKRLHPPHLDSEYKRKNQGKEKAESHLQNSYKSTTLHFFHIISKLLFCYSLSMLILSLLFSLKSFLIFIFFFGKAYEMSILRFVSTPLI